MILPSVDNLYFHCEERERLLGMEIHLSEERMFLVSPVHN